MSATPQYYKATQLDGTDFRTGTVDYAGAMLRSELVSHPHGTAMVRNKARTYLSVSTEPAETLIGGSWPCRLFRVEPVGEVLDGLSASTHKRACLHMHVVEELPAFLALGPNGAEVVTLIDQAASLTEEQSRRLATAWAAALTVARGAAMDAAGWDAAGWDTAGWDTAMDAAGWDAAGWDTAMGAARDAAGYAARGAARGAARDAAGYAARGAARYAARDAARALVVRDVLAPEYFQTLAEPWFAVMGDPRDLVQS